MQRLLVPVYYEIAPVCHGVLLSCSQHYKCCHKVKVKCTSDRLPGGTMCRVNLVRSTDSTHKKLVYTHEVP